MVTVLLAVQSVSFCVYTFKEFERVVQHHLLYVSVCRLSVCLSACLFISSELFLVLSNSLYSDVFPGARCC